MTDQPIIYHALICEDCFEINDCETKTEQWLVGDEEPSPFLLWACPACDHRHRLEIKGNVAEAIQSYNRHMRAVITGIQRAASTHKSSDGEKAAFHKRLEDARERDRAQGGNKHTRRVEFGGWVRRLRLDYEMFVPGQKLTIAAAARAAGVSREYWTRLELGQEGYSEEVVLRVNAVVGGTVERAYEMAGLPLPARLVRKTSQERMQAAIERYRSAMDIEDDVQWLSEALTARHSYWFAKLGFHEGKMLDIPARAHALSSAHQALKSIDMLPRQAERINVFRAVANTSVPPNKWLRWLQEIVKHALTDEQRQVLSQTLLALLTEQEHKSSRQ